MQAETNTFTYTKARIEVIEDHFQLFLKYGGMSNTEIDKLTEAVSNQELEAVGIYAIENGERVLEVEFLVNWEVHNQIVSSSGKMFNTQIDGWEDGLAPEATLAVRRLVRKARNNNWKISSWIRVTPSVRRTPSRHMAVCNKLGYSYTGTVTAWKKEPIERSRKVLDMEEATVTQRSTLS